MTPEQQEEVKAKPKRKRVPEYIPVKVIWWQQHTALVEYVIHLKDGTDLRRVLVPREVIHDDVAEKQDLEAGVPYGLPWEEIVSIRVTPELLAIEFRRLGLWTMEDLLSKPQKITEAVQRVNRLNHSAVIQAAKKYHKESEEKR